MENSNSSPRLRVSASPNLPPVIGRPWPADHKRATAHLHLRATPARKAAYLRSSRKSKQTLSEWCFQNLDQAAGYKAPAPASASEPA